MGSIIGGIFGGGEKSGAQEGQLAAMAKATEELKQYRQEAMQGRMNVLRDTLLAYEPMRNHNNMIMGGGKVGGGVGGPKTSTRGPLNGEIPPEELPPQGLPNWANGAVATVDPVVPPGPGPGGDVSYPWDQAKGRK